MLKQPDEEWIDRPNSNNNDKITFWVATICAFLVLAAIIVALHA